MIIIVIKIKMIYIYIYMIVREYVYIYIYNYYCCCCCCCGCCCCCSIWQVGLLLLRASWDVSMQLKCISHQHRTQPGWHPDLCLRSLALTGSPSGF